MSLSSLYLDAFFICAQTGHFTEAAGQLFITQSALSQRIAKLEDEIGTPLFIRKSSGISLTPAGEELLSFCLSKKALEEEALSRIQGDREQGLTGVIRIGGFSSVMRSAVLPSLKQLLVENTQVKLSLVSKEMDELPHALKRGEIDYMIHYDTLFKDGIEAIEIALERNVLVEKQNYMGPNIFLDHDEKDQATARYLKMIGDNQSYTRRYLDDVYGLIDGVRLGLGRAIVPLHLAKKYDDLKVIRKKKTLDFPLILHFNKAPYYTKLHGKIVESLAKNVKKYL